MSRDTRGKFLALVIGIFSTFTIGEFFASFLKVTDYIEIYPYTKCDTPSNPKKVECIPRFKPGKDYIYTKDFGTNKEITTRKSSNDIGMLSDTNFHDWKKENINPTINILIIGDSYVEARAVSNDKTFEALLNNQKSENKTFKTIWLGLSGRAFPTYIAYLKFVINNSDHKDYFLIIPIITNDFLESFYEFDYSKGEYFFDQKGNIFLNEYSRSIPSHMFSWALNRSSFVRYIYLNLRAFEVHSRLKNYFSKYRKSLDLQIEKEGITKAEKELKCKTGKLSSTFFIENLNRLRPLPYQRESTILLVESDRLDSALSNSTKAELSKCDREFFIEIAKKNGYTILDMKEFYKEAWEKDKRIFDFVNDQHWNSYTHYKLSEKLKILIDKIIKSSDS